MKLGNFCHIGLGFKSLMNAFFYIESERIKEFGIEDRYLLPLYRLDDLDSNQYMQRGEPRLSLFACWDEPADLKGTGAGAYIDWAARQETGRKKQAKQATTWRDALEKQGGRRWYFPKASPHTVQLAVRKAIGKRYAPFVFPEPVLVDQRLYTVTAKDGVDSDVLTAYLASSLFPLSLEVNSDLGLGAGVLTLGTEALRNLPCVDLLSLSRIDRRSKITSALYQALGSEPPLLETMARQRLESPLDDAFLSALNFEVARSFELREQVVRLGESRQKLAASRRVVRVRQAELNVEGVSREISTRAGSWLSGRRFPEDYIAGDGRVSLAFPSRALLVEAETVMTSTALKILTGAREVLYEEEVDSAVAELIVRSLQFGRRTFSISDNVLIAENALVQLGELLRELGAEVDRLVTEAGVGVRYEHEVRGKALRFLGVDLLDLQKTFASSDSWYIAETVTG